MMRGRRSGRSEGGGDGDGAGTGGGVPASHPHHAKDSIKHSTLGNDMAHSTCMHASMGMLRTLLTCVVFRVFGHADHDGMCVMSRFRCVESVAH